MGEHTIQCWSCGTRKTLEEIRTADGYCPECEVEIDLAEYYQKLAGDYDALQSRLDAAEAEVRRLREGLAKWKAAAVRRLEDWKVAVVANEFAASQLAERDQLRAENVMLTSTVERQANSIAELRARVAELERDAERYRWLREMHQSPYGLTLTVARVGMMDLTAWSGDDPDSVIDAAMAEQQGQGGEV